MKKVKQIGFATIKTMGFRQLKRKLKKDGVVENLNHIEFKLGVSKSGKECIKYRASGTSNLGVFAAEDYLAYGEISEELLKAKAYDLQTITLAELVSISEASEVHHSDMIFTRGYINCSCCMGGKLPLQAPMSLLEIMLYERERYYDELLSFQLRDQELLEEMDEVDFTNAQGLRFELIDTDWGICVEVSFHLYGVSCFISLLEFKTLKEKGIDSIGMEFFMMALAEGDFVYVDDMFFLSSFNNIECIPWRGIRDKELVRSVEREEEKGNGLVLGKNLKSTEDLVGCVRTQPTYRKEAA